MRFAGRAEKIGLDDPFPVAFLEGLADLPSESTEISIDRPAKKPRLDNEPTESITVARGELCISRRQHLPPHISPFIRHDVRKHMIFKVDGLGSAGTTIFWVLRSEPRMRKANSPKPFDAYIELAPGSFGDEIIALGVGRGEKDLVDLATTVNMEINVLRNDVVLKFTFDLHWNTRVLFGKTLAPRSPVGMAQKIVDLFLPVKDQHLDEATDWSPRDFYKAAFVPEKNDHDALAIEIPGLNAHLYPFQKRALKWLLAREGVRWTKPDGQSGGTIQSFEDPASLQLPLSFREIIDVDGKKAYMSDLFNLVTTDLSMFRLSDTIRGGILAEEMGLGKTLEIISLVLLHQRSDNMTGSLDNPSPELPGKTGATLIVTPVPLRDQWHAEVTAHAPKLRVAFYDGCRVESREEELALIRHLAEQDVVITTYNILTTEIWLARELPNRSRRFARQYHRPRSPLIQLQWWRVCLDEAQMIDSGVSNAAEVAKIIPRVNSWAISGTPVKKDVQDLRGLLIFLHYAPYNYDSSIWQALTTRHKRVFQQLFNRLALRHTKPMVRHEIKLPHQDRFVITVPFSAVEEHQYQSLVKEMAQECEVDLEGNPLAGDWDPDEHRETMMGWLRKLRISAVYPMSDLKYQRRRKPPQTEAEALNMLIELSETDVHSKSSAYLDFKLRRGMMLENGPRVREALTIWQEVYDEVSTVVEEIETKIEALLSEKAELEAYISSDDDDEKSNRAVLAEYRRKQRLALGVQHKAMFCCGNAYYQIRTNPEMTEPDSDEFKRLHRLEEESYERAQAIRIKVSDPALKKATRMMDRIRQKAANQSFVTIPEATVGSEKGLETRTVLDGFEGLCEALNGHAEKLDDWREEIVELLLKPLVRDSTSQDDDEMANEWTDSIAIQGKLEAYVKVLDAAIADREDAISGGSNTRVAHEMAMARSDALKEENRESAESEAFISLSNDRDKIKPPEMLGSVRGAISRLRHLQHQFAGSIRERNRLEAKIAGIQLQHAAKLADEQMEIAKALHQELRMFSAVTKARMDYYNQLQQMSDELDPYDGPKDEATIARRLGEEQRLKNEARNADMKRKYLLHLKESGGKKEDTPCIICQSPFTEGVLTACGHLFCRECMRLWWRAKRNCPLCKAHLHSYDLLDVVIRRQEMQVRSDNIADQNRQKRSTRDNGRRSTIYSEFSVDKLAAIQKIPLESESATSTKINMLVRHIGWLRRADPGAKSIVFTSFPFFLKALKEAFIEHGITYTSMGSVDGIAKFKSDANIEVFLLHAQGHASGLNLVEANHVFLCEPLLNTALELQAIARVDRIGQTHETTVWLYLMKGTVEESIYNLSASRRMEHLGAMGTRKGKEPVRDSDETLDEANRVEMESSQLSRLLTKDGEVVDPGDLWQCLFGNAPKDTDQEVTTTTGSEDTGAEMLEVR